MAAQPCTASCISETRVVQAPRADSSQAAAPEKQGTGGKVGKDKGPAQMIPIHTESLQPGGGVAPRLEVPPSAALWGVAPWLEVPLCSLPGPASSSAGRGACAHTPTGCRSSCRHTWAPSSPRSLAKLWPVLHNPMDCTSSGFPVLHHLPQFAQTHVH